MVTIGELAKQVGESVKTIRYWSDLAMLEPIRTKSNYRLYSESSLKRIKFIRTSQALGFSLSEIKAFIDLRKDGKQPCHEVISELNEHLKIVQKNLQELKNLELELKTRLKWAQEHPDADCDEGCVYLEAN